MKAIASELAYDGCSGRQRQIWVEMGPLLFHMEPWVVGAGACALQFCEGRMFVRASAWVRFEENAAVAVIRCRSPAWRVGLLDQMVIRHVLVSFWGPCMSISIALRLRVLSSHLGSSLRGVARGDW